MQSQVDSLQRGQPRLNFDVLRLLCSYVANVSDVLSFALTCSALTEDALRQRLRIAPVDLWSGELVTSFHAFIFSNELARAPCIYGLKLPSPWPYYDYQSRSESYVRSSIDSRIVAILGAATHVQYLHFKTSTSNSVFDAIAKLTTVHELHIFTDVPVYLGPLLNVLTNFQSPLRSLHISRSELAGCAIYASFLHDRLSQLAPTLEFLDTDSFPINIAPSSVTTQFTAVRSLKLQTPFPSDCDLLGVLMRLFPNLDDTLELGSLNAYLTEDDVPAFRERCQEAQKRHCWPGLDRLICDADTAYFLALQCPIRRMSIRIMHAWKWLSDALRYNCPRQLYVALDLDMGLGGLDGLFPPEAADRLTHLVVSARLGVYYRRSVRHKPNNVHWDRFIDRLVHSIRHLSLTHLRIVFRSSVHHSSRTPPQRHELFATARGVDLRPAASQLVRAMPSLRYLFLTAYGHTYVVPATKTQLGFERQTLDSWFSSSASLVSVAHDKAAPGPHPEPSDGSLTSMSSCVELSRDEGEKMIDLEDLSLSRDEEVGDLNFIWEMERP